MKVRELKPEVAEVFELVKIQPGKHHFNGFGVIDLTEIDLAQAEVLHKRGLHHLVRKDVKAESARPKAEVKPVIPPTQA
jgi:hypothetical protein